MRIKYFNTNININICQSNKAHITTSGSRAHRDDGQILLIKGVYLIFMQWF